MSIARHRHPADGGYQRGEETRARIIAAALKLFGERGFDGASTRDIATAADVNAPALQYYFDNKEGVYIACVEHIVSRVWEYVCDAVARGERVLAENADDETLIDAYCAIQGRLADFMFTATDAEEWRLFMARQQAGEGPIAAFQIPWQRFSNRISATSSAIVGRLLGRAPDDDETRIRTTALSGQLSVFQLARRSVLAKLNWDSINAERLTLLKRVVREQTEALLRSMVAMRDSRGPESRRGGARTRAKK
jgi:TetR/AcrR family transcriptional regulator, regulator of cefoperazone and chloramphenicol sensitivity